jgi:hypothetical protein
MALNQSDALDQLLPALLKVQATMSPALKTATNPHLKNKYATLGDIWDAVREPLAKNNLVVTQVGDDGSDDAGVNVVTTVYHISGQWISSRIRLPIEKSTAQAMGSAITYGRRYGLAALLGVITEDDDGHAASQGKVQRKGQAPARVTTEAPKGATAQAKGGGSGITIKGKPIEEHATADLISFIEWGMADDDRAVKNKTRIEAADRLVQQRRAGELNQMPSALVQPEHDDNPLPFDR